MPLFGEPFTGLKLGVLFAVPFLFLRVALDMAMLKQDIFNNGVQ
jgi:hypothetical protein